MRRRTCVALLASGLLASALVLAAPAPSEAASLRISRTEVISGEAVAITGSTGVRAVRPVQLQRQNGSRWTVLATSRTGTNGAFGFAFRGPWPADAARGAVLRVYAPKVKVRSRTYAPVVAGTRSVRTVPQSVAVEVGADVVAGAPVDVVGRFSPVRPGRPTRLQRWDGRAWTTVSTGVESPAGATLYDDIVLPDAGTALVRAIADSHGGAPVAVSPTDRVTVSAPPPLATPDPDACGEVPFKADGTPWRCTFADDFDGHALDRQAWVPQTHFATGTPSAFACYRDDADSIAVGDGALHLTVHKVATPVSCTFGSLSGPTNLVAGSVMTYQRFSQQFGRFEARMRTSAVRGQGLHEAFWLWPDDRVASTETWPAAGEIDIAETFSAYPDYALPFLHYGVRGNDPQNGVNTAYCAAPRGQWNTYTLEWSATRIEIAVNGRTCLVNTSGDPAFLKPYIMALTSGIGDVGNKYNGSAALPATTDVDYVRVWS